MYLDTSWLQRFSLTHHIFNFGFYAISIIAGITFMVGLGLIIRGLAAKRRDYKLSIRDDEGSIQISEEAALSSIHSTLAAYGGIVDSDIKLYLDDKAKTISTKIECTLVDMKNAEQYKKEIINRVESNLIQLTGLTVKKVDVIFYTAR